MVLAAFAAGLLLTPALTAGNEQGQISRTVWVNATLPGLFSKGLVAKGQIDLRGNNVQTDSFDSSDPAYSTNGRYDPAKKKDKGDVATNSSLTNSLSVGNAKIIGKVSTGPEGVVGIGPNGTVGSLAWHVSGNKGIEPGWSSDDMDVEFPDVQAPFSSAPQPVGGTVNGVTYDYIITSGNWKISSQTLKGKVLVTGEATVLVTSEIAFTGQDFLKIQPNASLKLYMAGEKTRLGGQGVLNESGKAENFYYFGLPANTSLSLSGNASFTGALYAPQATFTLGGGGNNTYDFVGAAVANTIKLNGHFNFHYDENLAKVGPSRGYVITAWHEAYPRLP